MASPNDLSFLPDDYLKQKARKRANILCASLAMVVFGTVGAAFWLSERSMRDLDAELAQVDRKYNDATEQINAVKVMHKKQKQIVQHAELAAALVERVPRSNVLATFTNSLPPGVSLLEVSMESKLKQPAATATSGNVFDARVAAAQKKAATNNDPPKYDVLVRLTGVADNDVQVGEFISKLTKSSLLKDVNLVISDTMSREKEKSSLRRFQLEMMLNPTADVGDSPVALKVAGGEEK